jgi:phospholipid transport system transporter-binding protein
MRLPETLTLAEAGAALPALQAALAAAPGGALVIDASPLRVFDSAALALLLQARRAAQSMGLAFEVQAAPPKLTQLAQLYGVAELLRLQPAA